MENFSRHSVRRQLAYGSVYVCLCTEQLIGSILSVRDSRTLSHLNRETDRQCVCGGKHANQSVPLIGSREPLPLLPALVGPFGKEEEEEDGEER